MGVHYPFQILSISENLYNKKSIEKWYYSIKILLTSYSSRVGGLDMIIIIMTKITSTDYFLCMQHNVLSIFMYWLI